VNNSGPANERSSPAIWLAWAMVYVVLAATLVNVPIYIWVLRRQGGTALGTQPARDSYYLVQRRLIRARTDDDRGDQPAATPVDRHTWAFNLYYTAATRLSFVLGLGCFLLVLGRVLVGQYFTGGQDETQGRPGRFSLRFAAVVVAAFFALVAWEIGGRTVREFMHSYSIYNSLDP
jgi:hypothetical protein